MRASWTSFFGLDPSSTLSERCKKLLSFTGDPLCPPISGPFVPLVPPLLPVLGEGVLRCGMFSGSGCWEPIVVTPTSEALPALESA